ncbi:MAG: acyltransferase family protein [Paracoccus hibiscisoli]|uniref:acyltransferase family protein n=1 Tax=Paracoccus hibiscisoli TaxID=2023261 RepID=UPI003919E07C
MSSTPQPARLVWLDALRGLTIVLMVAGHVARGLWATGRIDWPDYRLYDAALYVFHGPLFFVLCGITLCCAGGRGRLLDDWPRRLGRLAHPYLVWTLITATATLAMGGAVNNPLGWSAFLTIVLGMPVWPYSIFWFLYVLILCQIAMAILRERRGHSAGRILALSVAGLGAGYVIRALVGPIEAFQVTTFLTMFFFFSWGHWLGARPDILTRRVLVVSCILSLLCWGAILGLGWNIDTPFGGFAGLCITTFLIALVRRGAGSVPGAVMAAAAYVGIMSMEIYVIHHLLAGFARIVLSRLGVEALWIYGAVGLIAGVVGPILVAALFRRAGVAGLLGLPPPRRPAPAARPAVGAVP